MRWLSVRNDGLDELSISSENTVHEVTVNGKVDVRSYRLTAEDAGLKSAPLATVRGGSVAENAALVRRILDGVDSAARTITLLNAAAALYAADAASSIGEGVAIAAESIDSGAARAKLDHLATLTQQLGAA